MLLKSAFTFAILLASSLAFAGLGDLEASTQTDARALSGTHRVLKVASASTGGVSSHEVTASGVTVKEYVNADGRIFAVTWAGRRAPDLSVLLGSNFNDYVNTVKGSPRVHGRAPLVVDTSKMKMVMAGHPGDLHGKAYVPSLVPKDFDLNDIN